MSKKYDFSGWATKNDLKCSDGRTIRQDAFKDNDGQIVPLVWNHQHNETSNVLGHALLENRKEGVYAYCTFNDTENGQTARELVKHGDVKSLSIYANQLQQRGGDVLHGAIREVSLVLAGANPQALIDSVLYHSDGSPESVIICCADEHLSFAHAESMREAPQEEKVKMAQPANGGSTIRDIFNTFNDDQKKVVYALIGKAIENATNGTTEGAPDMKHNVFENDNTENILSHSDMEAVFSDAKRYGSLRDSVLAHGIADIEYLFPEAQATSNTPEWIKRPDGWVSKVLNGTHHSPFSRIKSMFADITEDDARALGYLPDHTHRDDKGNLVDADGNPAFKKEEVFSLLKRSTTPTTIYKKQKLDRDDVIDITDFDVVAWIKTEMRGMLDEELARAVLIGDGRLASSDDKINEQNIRPILSDSDFFTVKYGVAAASGVDTAVEMVDSTVRARHLYKGSGTPTFFTTEDVLADLLLIKDGMGHRMYKNEGELASAMRVKEIVTVPVMDGVKYDNKKLFGIMVNLSDYSIGADKGGSVNMFDDFDIDYNAQKYLMETRCSGALTKPFSAIVFYADSTKAKGTYSATSQSPSAYEKDGLTKKTTTSGFSI